MRIIAYQQGFDTPVIQHIKKPDNVQIYGGKLVDNGKKALLYLGGIVAVVKLEPAPENLREAMERRADEIEANRGDVFSSIVAPIIAANKKAERRRRKLAEQALAAERDSEPSEERTAIG